MKKIISISVDEELHEKAKRLMNVSEVAEAAIKQKLNIQEIEIKDVCEFCGKAESKAYVDHKTDEYHDGLTWLCPDEKWICTNCIGFKSNALKKIASGNAE